MDEKYLGNELNSFIQTIKNMTELPEESYTEENLKLIENSITENFTDEVKEQSINQIIKNMEDQRLNRAEAKLSIDALINTLNDMIYDETYTPAKKRLVDKMMAPMYDIFHSALDRFHLYHIDLPMKLEKGAKIPSYAHDTDACADLYALEDTKVGAHTYGNKLRTGVSIQLPEGWLAMIFPRSSIGAKTPMRLSNSVGIIDSGYRGELGVLYDNTSDELQVISAGDRIAQLLVMPSYRFQPKVVDILEASDRGEGGFGSTGT